MYTIPTHDLIVLPGVTFYFQKEYFKEIVKKEAVVGEEAVFLVLKEDKTRSEMTAEDFYPIGARGVIDNIDKDGNVYVNDQLLDEPYMAGKEKALGDCNIELPYQVPDGRYFVMGDHRSTSIDSRNTAVGCVAEEQIVGRIVFRIWPLNTFGKVS